MYKDPNRFRMQFQNGAWYYSCYTTEGKRIKRSTGTADKEKALLLIHERIKLGCLVNPPKTNPMITVHKIPDGDVPFALYAEQFFDYERCPYVHDRLVRGGHLTRGFVKSLRGILMNRIIPYFGGMMLSGIRKADVNRWLLSLPATGMSNSTANKHLNALGIIMAQAEFEERIERNPCNGVRPLVPRPKNRLAFTVEQENRLVSYPYDSILMTVAVRLAATTGMRRGEIRALKWSDVRMDRIVVAHSYTNKDGYKGTKSGKVREVPLRPDVYELIASLFHGDVDAYLFSFNGQTPVYSDFFNDRLKKAMADLGIDNQGGRLSFHSFRHFFNTRLIEGGVQSVVVQAVVGHSSDAMTSHYLHVDAGRLDDVKQIQKSISIG